MAVTVSASAVRGIRLQADDDVAITTADVAAGTPVDVGDGRPVAARNDVPRGHKLAVRDLAAGAPVHRYGQVIGFTRGPVAAGEHVHLHNLEYREFERAYEFAVGGQPEPVLPEAERRLVGRFDEVEELPQQAAA